MYDSLRNAMESIGILAKYTVYVGEGQSTGSLGQSAAVYSKSAAVYGSLGQATGSLEESTGSKGMSSQVLGGLGEFTVV